MVVIIILLITILGKKKNKVIPRKGKESTEHINNPFPILRNKKNLTNSHKRIKKLTKMRTYKGIKCF